MKFFFLFPILTCFDNPGYLSDILLPPGLTRNAFLGLPNSESVLAKLKPVLDLDCFALLNLWIARPEWYVATSEEVRAARLCFEGVERSPDFAELHPVLYDSRLESFLNSSPPSSSQSAPQTPPSFSEYVREHKISFPVDRIKTAIVDHATDRYLALLLSTQFSHPLTAHLGDLVDWMFVHRSATETALFWTFLADHGVDESALESGKFAVVNNPVVEFQNRLVMYHVGMGTGFRWWANRVGAFLGSLVSENQEAFFACISPAEQEQIFASPFTTVRTLFRIVENAQVWEVVKLYMCVADQVTAGLFPRVMTQDESLNVLFHLVRVATSPLAALAMAKESVN